MWVLVISLMLHQFFKDETWDIPRYIEAVFATIFGTIGSLLSPFFHFNFYIQNSEKNKNHKIQYIFVGILISIPMVWIILLLLSGADYVFANILEKLWKDIVIPENVVGVIAMTIFACFAAYGFMAYLSKERPEVPQGKRNHGEPLIAITFTGITTLIYLIFCGIQIMYLFVGKMKLPENYTYSQYAREGFFQLVFICLINISLVLFCHYFYKENKILKILLLTISSCTYIIVLSSVYKMLLYIGQYQLTLLRVFVLWLLLGIFLVITGIIITIIKKEFPLFKFTFITIISIYVLFAISFPDYYIAKYNYREILNGNYLNLENENSDETSNETIYETSYENVGNTDMLYLYQLSGDAAPVVKEIAKKLNEATVETNVNYELENILEYFTRIQDKTYNMNIRTFNVSGYLSSEIANQYLKENLSNKKN
jgi:hypothetical protein